LLCVLGRGGGEEGEKGTRSTSGKTAKKRRGDIKSRGRSAGQYCFIGDSTNINELLI
jgi:hypothetical protein